MEPESFELILDRYQSGEADPKEVAELERILRSDSTKRRRFVERFLLEVQLSKVCSGVLPKSETYHKPSRGRRRVRVWLGLAAGILVLAAGAFVFRFGEKQVEAPVLLAGIVRVGDRPAQEIPIGVGFEVGKDEAAVIRLSDDSRIELAPFSKATIQGKVGEARQTVELTEGSGLFRVVPGSGAFRVETPAGTVTVLGTEFSVRLKARRNRKAAMPALAVKVMTGSVRVESGGKSAILSAGKSRVFGDDGDQNNQDDGQQNNRNDGDRSNDKQPESK